MASIRCRLFLQGLTDSTKGSEEALGRALAAPYLIQAEGKRPRTRYGLRLEAGAIRFGAGGLGMDA